MTIPKINRIISTNKWSVVTILSVVLKHDVRALYAHQREETPDE